MKHSLALMPTVATVALLSALAHSTAPAPAAGPGAVLAMHRALFAALDAGDALALPGFFGESPAGMAFDPPDDWSKTPGSRFYLLAADDRPAAPVAAAGVPALLAAWAAAGEETRIARAWSDCSSGELSFCIAELERTGPDGRVRRYRSSSLVRWTGGAWKMVHWHLSPADAGDARVHD